MRSSRIWRAATADERGAAAVEFALVVPVFMLIVFGMIDFTRAYYTQSAIAAAVREGARTAAVLPDPVNDATQLAKVKSPVASRERGTDAQAHHPAGDLPLRTDRRVDAAGAVTVTHR